MFKDTRNYAASIVAAGLFLPALTLAGAGDAFAVPSEPPIFGDPQFAVGVEPRDVEVADLDGDGTVDLVVPNFFDRTVSVMLGTGGGGFVEHAVLPVDGGPQAVAIADFDGDGDADFAVAQRTPNQVTVFQGDGSGNFTLSANIGVSGRAQDIVAANLAGGVSPDLAVAITGGTEGVTLLVNDGAGVFADDGVVFDTSDRFGLAAGDLDGDGDKDLVAGTSFQVTVFRNTASGFTASSSLMVGGIAFRVALGDLDDDGDLDLAATAFGANEVLIATNLGDGRFAPARSEALGPVNVFSVDIADLNGDRCGEILAVAARDSTGPGLLAILSGDPATGFTLSTQEVATLPVSLRAARIDGDARVDVAIVGGTFGLDFLPSHLTVLLNRGFGGLGGYRVYETADAPEAVIATDLDGDGSQDLAVANFRGTSISILLNNGFGLFSAAGPVTSDHPLSIAADDLDGDGDNDLVVGNDVRFLTRHRNRGDGSFAPAEILPPPAGRRPQVAIADMNGDTFKDIVMATSLPRQVLVLFNDGTGAFPSSSSQVTTVSQSPSLVLADVDGMAGLDAIIVERFGDSMSVLLNDGSGNLGTASLVPILVMPDPESNPVAVASADIDDDGDPDVAVADRGLGVVHLFENVSGTLMPLSTLPAGDEVASAILADLNNDSEVDLVTSNALAATHPSASVRLRLGDGTGAFGDPQAYMAGRGALGMVAANLTRGSSKDLAVTDSDQGSLWVLIVGGGTISVEIDTDLDGLSDILEAELSLDFLDPDSDDDGLADGLDPDVIGGVILDIPTPLFSSPGQKGSLVAHLLGVEALLKKRQPDLAIGQLTNLGTRFDGCLSQKDPDASDWITDCNAQFRVRRVFDVVVENLFSVTPLPQPTEGGPQPEPPTEPPTQN